VVANGYAVFDRSLRRWAELSDTELAKAHAIFRPVRQPAGTLLQRAGEPSEYVSFIVRGLTRIYYLGDGGVERTKAFRAEGELVCAYSAALVRAPSEQFIETLEPCELLTAPQRAFGDLCAAEPGWAALVATLTRRLFVTGERRHQEFLVNDATARYRAFIEAEPALVRRLTQRQIASYVGVSPEALSRIRTALGVARVTAHD
jgi:CRP-like cAMP-binding protein